MRKRRVFWVALFPFVFGLLPAPVGRADDRPQHLYLTILHTNDMHGHLMPFSYPDPENTSSPVADMSATRNIGGIARCATLVARIKREEDREVLLLDAGDIMDGTPFSVCYHGLADIEAMNVVGYDAMVAGNHEFNMTFEEFEELVAAADFPILCANVRIRGDREPVMPAHTIFDRGGLRIGLFGLTTMSSQSYRACRDRIDILDPIQVAGRMVSILRDERVDLVVALTHLGFSGDLALADSVPEIDVIVGGHSHTRLDRPRVVPHGEPEAAGYRQTLVVQAFQWAGELGRLDLTLARGGEGTDEVGAYRVVSHHGELIPLTADIPEDRSVAEVVSRFYEPMRPVYDVKIGEAADDLANIGFERATVNLVADAMREATGVDVALQNYGGVRESILKGPIRIWEIHSMLPFGNRIALMKMNGHRLREALAAGNESFGFSGMTVVWEEDEPTEIEIAGRRLDDHRLYSVATNSYISDKCFSDIEEVNVTDRLVRDVVTDHIREKGTIHPVLDGRTR